ncbi:MAG: hypothetical protein R6U57_07810 [Anaerolineales bacterium]
MTIDSQDFIEEEEQTSPSLKISSALIWNILTGLLLVGTVVVGLVFLMIFFNPQSGLNPLPPTTMPALVPTFTASPTPKEVLPPTWTPTLSPTLPPTETPGPTDTPLPPTIEPSPTPTAQASSDKSFVLQVDSPKYMENFAHEESGCQWLGVAGQVFDEEGNPLDDILVSVKGTLGGEEINRFIFTGLVEEYVEDYGEGAYEVELADAPIASQGALYIQLFEQTNDLALSDKIYFDTYDSCDRNLIIINFVQEPVP